LLVTVAVTVLAVQSPEPPALQPRKALNVELGGVALPAKPTARFAMRLIPDLPVASASSPASSRLIVQSQLPETINFEVTLEATGHAVLAQSPDVSFSITAAEAAREIPIAYGV